MIPTRQHVIDWVSELVSEEIIIKSLLVCGISNAVDGSQDRLIREEVPRDLGDSSDEESLCEDYDVDPFSDLDD